jgi:hypothetical protein
MSSAWDAAVASRFVEEIRRARTRGTLPSDSGRTGNEGSDHAHRESDDVGALPNRSRHPYARWDANVHVPDPDALAAEFGDRGVAFSAPLTDAHDGLRGFELTDHDGYVLFFGRPADDPTVAGGGV